MLMSLDGKMNSGSSDELDVDRDWCNIPHIKEGLHQYYEIEQTTDCYSLNTGRVMAKVGANERPFGDKWGVSFIAVDNLPHLNEHGVEYYARISERFFVVANNPSHPAHALCEKFDNIVMLPYSGKLSLADMLEMLYEKGVERLTVQSGGTLNGAFLRENLFDFVNIVVAPVLVGGKDTPSIIDGQAITSPLQLSLIRPLRLLEANTLEDSYIQLKYEVIK